jgi:hypothetical protein
MKASLAPLTIDKDFPRRVFKTSMVLSALITLLLFLYGQWSITLGFMIGAAISILFFKILWWTVDQIFKRSGKKALYFSLKIFIVKFPLLGILLYYLFLNVDINPFALVSGIAVLQAVMFLKAIGVVIANSTRKSAQSRDTKPPNSEPMENNPGRIAP